MMEDKRLVTNVQESSSYKNLEKSWLVTISAPFPDSCDAASL
jgi:hypothetical protein